MNEIKYFLAFFERYREEDDEPLYTVECYNKDDFKTKDNLINWWYKRVEEDEYLRDWDTLELEFVKEVNQSELKKYEKNKQYDCRWR